MYFFSKLLPLFVLPLGFSLILLVYGIARGRRKVAWAGVLVLYLSSNPMVGHLLIRYAEGWTERRALAEVPTGDAIVVLSAGRSLAPGPDRVSEWRDANRFFGGMELALAGKAPLLIFTGAAITSQPGVPSEGETLAAQARALGVPAERILVTPRVLNTDDEAREVATLLRARQIQNPRVLLVTSAFHMRRSDQLFRQSGLVVEPFPVAFRSPGARSLSVFSFLPSVGALEETQTALHELYGRVFYWLRGAFASR